MRTTLNLDADVASDLETLRKANNVTLREIANEALRRGLREMMNPSKPRGVLRTRSVSLGGLQITSIDNIAEVLAASEKEDFK
jgi:hypothetical protein